MKSTSSFTWLPDFGLYCSSKNFFMTRVGGQSGTAMVNVTSSARAVEISATPNDAATPAAINAPLIFVLVLIFGFPPSYLLPIFLHGVVRQMIVRRSPARSKPGRYETCLGRERPRWLARAAARRQPIP